MSPQLLLTIEILHDQNIKNCGSYGSRVYIGSCRISIVKQYLCISGSKVAIVYILAGLGKETEARTRTMYNSLDEIPTSRTSDHPEA